MGSEVYSGVQPVAAATSQFNAMAAIAKSAIGQIATATLVQIVSVDPATRTVDVHPMIAQLDGLGKATPHGVIHGVPYMRLQGGTNAIIIDPVVGDIGIAVFASHDISAVKSTKKSANPGSRRRFSMADALYLGGVLNVDPTQSLAFADTGVTITSPNAVAVDAASIALGAPTSVAGAVDVTGPVDATGPVTTPSTVTGGMDVIGGGYSLVAVANALSAVIARLPGGGGSIGSVTSVNGSGGTTGLTFGGGPITGAGTLILSGTLDIANGGTGATTAATARAALGAGTVTSIDVGGGTTGLTFSGGPVTSAGTFTLAGTLALASGGTGATTASAARTALGAGTVTSVATGAGLTGGPVTGAGTIALANTAVAPGSYTNANITVDAQGRLTAAANGTGTAVTAPVIRGSSAFTNASTSSFTVTFPVGTAAGDLAFLFYAGGFGANGPPTGWTNTTFVLGTNWNGAVFQRTLNTADVTAGSVTVSTSSGGTFNGILSVVVLTGYYDVRSALSQQNGTGAATRTLATDGAPQLTDLIIYFGSNRNASTDTVSLGSAVRATNGTNASGVITAGSPTGLGGVSPVFGYGTFSGTTGDFQAAVVIKGR